MTKDTNYVTLFDLGLDPYEMNDRFPAARTDAGVQRLVDRLDAILTVMAYCRSSSCRNPYSVLHPDGTVATLVDAMRPQYDSFYSSRVKFGFLRCELHYDPLNERADPRITAALLAG